MLRPSVGGSIKLRFSIACSWAGKGVPLWNISRPGCGGIRGAFSLLATVPGPRFARTLKDNGSLGNARGAGYAFLDRTPLGKVARHQELGKREATRASH